jgi:hypothetical protein
MHPSRFSSNNSARYPQQKTQGLPQAKFIEEAYSKREPVQHPKLRYFKPFEFFDHTGRVRKRPRTSMKNAKRASRAVAKTN